MTTFNYYKTVLTNTSVAQKIVLLMQIKSMVIFTYYKTVFTSTSTANKDITYTSKINTNGFFCSNAAIALFFT